MVIRKIVQRMVEVLLECHFGVPMLGRVLNALTTRLDAEAIAFMLEQCEAKMSIADREYGEVIKQPVSQFYKPLKLIDVNDLQLVCGGIQVRIPPNVNAHSG